MKPWSTALLALAATLVLAAPASAHDAFPCGKQRHAAWTNHLVQKCDLGHPYAHNRIPVYASPVPHAKGARKPKAIGHLQGTANQYFVCQARVPSAEYYHPKGWRNDWWAYTKSDDHHWGWVPEVFFRGGNNDEADAGLIPCVTAPTAPKPKPKPKPKSSCATYSIMGLRGSGQTLNGPLKMGSTVGLTAEAAVRKLHRDHPSARIRTWSVPYPAVSVGKIFAGHPSVFAASMRKGERMLGARIRATVRRCPKTRIGVIGYSQGAGVASRTMRALSTSVLHHVRMLWLYADTDSWGISPYSVTYNYSRQEPVFYRFDGHGIFGKRKLPAAIPHKVDFCFVQDIVCVLPKSAVWKAIFLKFTYVHSHYWDFVADGERLVDEAGAGVAIGMEH